MDDKILMFVGVNAGYSGQQLQYPNFGEVTRKAAEIIIAARRLTKDHNTYEICPAVAIYPVVWGGVHGGEPVAAFMSSDNDEQAAVNTARYLRARLQQKDLYVALFSSGGSLGKNTLNFHATTTLDLTELGKLWQEAADEVMMDTNIYVSACAYNNGHSTIISAQANHTYLEDIKARTEDWAAAAARVCKTVSSNARIKITPKFSEARYVYLDTELGRQSPNL